MQDIKQMDDTQFVHVVSAVIAMLALIPTVFIVAFTGNLSIGGDGLVFAGFSAFIVEALWRAAGRLSLWRLRSIMSQEIRWFALDRKESEAKPVLPSVQGENKAELAKLYVEREALNAEVETLRSSDAGRHEDLRRRVERFANQLAVQADMVTRDDRGEVYFARIIKNVLDLKSTIINFREEIAGVRNTLEAVCQECDREQAAREVAVRRVHEVTEQAQRAVEDANLDRNEKVRKANERLAVVKQKLSEMEARVQAAEPQVVEQQSRIFYLEQQQGDVEALHSELQSLHSQIGEDEHKRRRLSEDLVSAQREAAAVRLESKNFQTRVAGLESECRRLTDDYLNVIAEVDLANQQISQMLLTIRRATGISKLSPGTLAESLEYWHAGINAHLQEFAEREAVAEAHAKEAEEKLMWVRAELSRLEDDHKALDDAHHELLADLGKMPEEPIVPETHRARGIVNEAAEALDAGRAADDESDPNPWQS